MRILHLHWAFFPVCGGVESHLETLLSELTCKGHEVELVTGTYHCSWPAGDQRCGLSYSRILDLNFRESLEDADHDFLQEKINNAEIVHFHNLHYFDYNRARLILGMFGQSGNFAFHTIHESWSEGVNREILDWKGWSNQFVISNYIRTSLIKNGHEFRYKLIKYAAGSQFESKQLMQEARDVLFSGIEGFVVLHPARLLPWKGANVSIRALEMLVSEGYDVYLILTDTPEVLDWTRELGKYESEIRDLVSSLRPDVRDRIMIKTFNRKDIPTLFKAADVIIYPTTGEEPFGVVPVEAIFSERVPVVSDSGGLTETVCHEQNGLVVKADDVDDLKSALVRLYNSQGLRERLISGGKNIRDEYSPSDMANLHLAMYENAKR